MRDNRKPRGQETSNFNFRDRRKKDDWVIHMATILSLLSWIVAFTVWVVLDKAKPESENMITRYFGVKVRDFWDTSLLPMALGLLIVSLCISIFAFIFNMLRMKRKTDKYRKSIIITGLGTITGIVFFLIRFGTEIFI